MTKGRVRNLAKEGLWRRRLDRQAGSGRTVRAWCRLHGVTEASFHWWRRELPRRDGEQPLRARCDKEGAPSARRSAEEPLSVRRSAAKPFAVRGTGKARPALFVPVHVTDDSSWDDDGQIEIELPDGRRVRVTGTVSRAMLTRVLDVLTSMSVVAAEGRAC